MSDPDVIVIRGGLHGGDPTHAAAGAHVWERGEGEAFTAFQARAVAAAADAGEAFVTLGGLPDARIAPFTLSGFPTRISSDLARGENSEAVRAMLAGRTA